MNELNDNSIVIRKAGLPSTVVDEDLIVLNLTANNYAGLDAVGRQIFERLAGPTRVGTLSDELAAHFSGPAEVIRKDVLAFVNQLHDEGLVEIAGLK